MAIWYVDIVSGDDATGFGTAAAPWKTFNKAVTSSSATDEIRIAKTAAHTNVAVANCTFTDGSVTVLTSASLVGTIAVGDYIGKPTAKGNGDFETFYKVSAVAAGSLTLYVKYHGTTGIVSSILKLTYVNEAYVTTRLCVVNKALTISGGWDLSTLLQDGETWFKTNAATAYSTSFDGFYISSTGVTLTNLNMVQSYHAFGCAINTVPLINYCCFIGIYSWLDFASGDASYRYPCGDMSHCVIYSILEPARHFYYTNTDVTIPINIDNCLLFSATGATDAYGIWIRGNAFVTLNLTNCYILADSGIYTAISIRNLNLTGTQFRHCSTGILNANSGSKIFNGYFYKCASGITNNTTGGGNVYVYNCTFNACTSYGIYIGLQSFIDIDSCVFLFCYYDVYNDDARTQGFKFSNCTSTTPTLYSVYVPLNTPPIYVSNCTIDAASKAKAFYDIAGANYIRPRFVITNWEGTDLLDGAYYANFTLVKNTGTYRTAPPCLQFTFKSTSSYHPSPVKLWSVYGESGKSYDISLYIKAGAGWAGTLEPMIRFNGGTMTTGVTLTSLSESWTQYTYTIEDLPSDGEISYEVIPNHNTTVVYYDDFTLTKEIL